MSISLLVVLYVLVSGVIWVTKCYDQNTFLPPSKTDYCSPCGEIETSCCDYGTIEGINREISVNIKKLLSSLYFRYYKINLHRKCPFWEEKPFCLLNSCAVTPCEQEQIPPFVVDYYDLAKVKYPSVEHNISYLKKLSDEFLVLEQNDPDAVFVNLLDNPERFTGYAGSNAQRVWNTIYGQNSCSEDSESRQSNFINHMTSEPLTPEEARESSMESLEKRVYYRIVSGLHASISTHIAMEFLDTESGKWVKNFELFHDRVGSHSERIKNMFFVYMVILRGLTKLSAYFEEYPFLDEAGNQDVKLMELVAEIIKSAGTCSTRFEDALLSQPDNLQIIRKLKYKFQAATRTIDCIACEKCRLWGKIQLTGVGTALKAIFDLNQSNPKAPFELSREEVVAMFNVLGRFSESLIALDDFRTMYNENPPKYEFHSKPEVPLTTSTKASNNSTSKNANEKATNIDKKQVNVAREDKVVREEIKAQEEKKSPEQESKNSFSADIVKNVHSVIKKIIAPRIARIFNI